jgi:hypothetical protein
MNPAIAGAVIVAFVTFLVVIEAWSAHLSKKLLNIGALHCVLQPNNA